MPISFRIRHSCRQPLGTLTSNRQPRPQDRPQALHLPEQLGEVVEIDLGGEARVGREVSERGVVIVRRGGLPPVGVESTSGHGPPGMPAGLNSKP